MACASQENDRIITSANARAVLTFFDGSTVTLEPDTVLVIRSVQRQDEQLVARLIQEQGRTWTHVPEGLGPADLTIETPNAAAETHGGSVTFETAVADGRTQVAAGSGAVSVQSGGDRADVPTGSRSSVESSGSLTQPSVSPQAVRELAVSIDGADYAHVIDPSGATIGVVAPGVPVNQVNGASVSSAGGRILLRIPEPLDGIYRLSACSEEDRAINVEAIVRDGGSETTVASFKAGAKETWQVRFDVSGYRVDPQAIARDSQPVAPAVIPDAAADKAQQNATPIAARPTQTPTADGPPPTSSPTKHADSPSGRHKDSRHPRSQRSQQRNDDGAGGAVDDEP